MDSLSVERMEVINMQAEQRVVGGVVDLCQMVSDRYQPPCPRPRRSVVVGGGAAASAAAAQLGPRRAGWRLAVRPGRGGQRSLVPDPSAPPLPSGAGQTAHPSGGGAGVNQSRAACLHFGEVLA